MSEGDGSMTVRSSLSSFLKILSSHNSNVLLVAILFLLIVVFFVLLLHFYARFFWSPTHQDLYPPRSRRRRTVITTTRIIPSVPLGGFDGDKGLDIWMISSIPLFVYEDEEDTEGEEEECVICLGLWQVGDFGRKLRNCGHGFHVECIDMWLSSHSTCPLCRSPVVVASNEEDNLKPAINGVEEEAEVRLQLFPAEENENIASDQRISVSLALVEDDLKTEFDEDDGVGEGEVRIEVVSGEDEEINGGGLSRRSTSMASSSSLRRMFSSRSSRQDSSS